MEKSKKCEGKNENKQLQKSCYQMFYITFKWKKKKKKQGRVIAKSVTEAENPHREQKVNRQLEGFVPDNLQYFYPIFLILKRV